MSHNTQQQKPAVTIPRNVAIKYAYDVIIPDLKTVARVIADHTIFSHNIDNAKGGYDTIVAYCETHGPAHSFWSSMVEYDAPNKAVWKQNAHSSFKSSVIDMMSLETDYSYVSIPTMIAQQICRWEDVHLFNEPELACLALAQVKADLGDILNVTYNTTTQELEGEKFVYLVNNYKQSIETITRK